MINRIIEIYIDQRYKNLLNGIDYSNVVNISPHIQNKEMIAVTSGLIDIIRELGQRIEDSNKNIIMLSREIELLKKANKPNAKK